MIINQIFAIVEKEVRSELRTRYAISAVFLFVLTSVAAAAFGLAGVSLVPSASAALLWVIMFFGSMTGLAKSFVSEEERSTALLLRVNAPAQAVYFGKLLFNFALSLLLNLTASLLFILMISGATAHHIAEFFISALVAAVGLSSATTIISAIISKANTRNSLLPVLSFPSLLPVIIPGVETTAAVFSSAPLSGSEINNFLLILSYSGILIIVSNILFGYVWQE